MSKTTEIAEGVHRIEWQLGVRRIAQWLVIGRDQIALIDTGVDGTVGEHVLPALEQLGRRREELTTVIISHADVDHYGGNAEIRRLVPAAQIFSSTADRPLIESWTTIRAERYDWYVEHGLGYDAPTMQWLQDAAGADTRLDGTVADGQVLDLGGATLEVLALPGHTAGHIGVVHRESGVAIIADAALERGLYDVEDTLISPPPYVTADGYAASIRRLQELAPERLETAHYPSLAGTAVDVFLDRSAAFAAELGDIVAGEIAQRPATVASIAATADTRLGPFSEMRHELARSVGAHLELLERGGRARRTDGVVPTWTA